MQWTRYYKVDIGLTHLSKLPLGYAFLQGKKVLRRNSIGFVENLPPAFFDCRFSSQHLELIGWIIGVVVSCLRREYEIRAVARFGRWLENVGDVFLGEDGMQLQFQRPPRP